MITKSQIKNWRTSYNFLHLIQGQGKYNNVSEELRVYACELFVEKIFKPLTGSVLALHEAMFIAAAKDEKSQKLLLNTLITNKVIVRDAAWEKLLMNIKTGCLQLVSQLNYEEESFEFDRCKGCGYYDKCEKQGFCEDWGA